MADVLYFYAAQALDKAVKVMGDDQKAGVEIVKCFLAVTLLDKLLKMPNGVDGSVIVGR